MDIEYKASRHEIIEKSRPVLKDFMELRNAGLICRSGSFFPSVHYPPITMYPPIASKELFNGYLLPEDHLFDVYVHIPFCRQRCNFCHYPVSIGDQEIEKERYLDALDEEMTIYMRQLGIDRIKTRSILVGGGTPTYLTPAQLERFLSFFVNRLDISQCRQFNYDVDPLTLLGKDGSERLRIMRDYGVDRLSIGVQALNDRVLAKMNRHHSVKQTLEAIDSCKKLGYRINTEFIFGYPGQTLDDWMDDLDHVISLDVDEIQLYRLKIDAYGDYQGKIKDMVERSHDDVPSVEETLLMKRIAIEMLSEQGYFENIRRVFTRNKEYFSAYAYDQCCMLYDQLGFGLTAFSSLRDRFGLNTQYMEEYYSMIESGKVPINRGMVRSKEEQARWAIILPLKNSHLSKKQYQINSGFSLDKIFREKFDRLKSFDLITENEQRIELTKLGAFFADEVVQQFHHPNFAPFPSHEYAAGPLNPYEGAEPWQLER